MQMRPLDMPELETVQKADKKSLRDDLARELELLDRKIVVLDDDPTGVQTVHGVPVYTSWDIKAFESGFAEDKNLFFILTNSRAMTEAQTRAAHIEIARNLSAVSSSTGKDYILISRSDSTLRGHYPLETQTLRAEIEVCSSKRFTGEIIYPFFLEGGRYTIGGVHYVLEGDRLIPAGMTEFARDKSFWYSSSRLDEWCEEKSGGKVKARDVTGITLEELRARDYIKTEEKLLAAENFAKITVDSADYTDVMAFAVAFIRASRKGGEFILRSAASVVKILGGIEDRPLLAKDEIIAPGNKNGGIIIIGSHVKKTTAQLEALREAGRGVVFLEFNQHLALEAGGLEREAKRVTAAARKYILSGDTAVIYTKREFLDIDGANADEQLDISVRISKALTSVVSGLDIKPGFIVAKGGITSSDVGIKALGVKRAVVMGQIKPGIPVWMTGAESRFPGMPFVIFPGNVGGKNTLLDIVEGLIG